MNQLAEKIAAETGRHGTISFARFMELALYCPVYGYYEKEGDKIGRRGDFYTSVSVGNLFGELLACQFCEWLDGSAAGQECQFPGAGCHAGGQPASPVASTEAFQLVEAGAHQGDLALDILRWIREQRPLLFDRLQYWIVEPSSRRQECQQQTLAAFAGRVHWVSDFAALKAGPEQNAFSGSASTIVFSNELLDAMPVHRVAWDAGAHAWFEWGVAFEDQRFVWARMPPDPARVQSLIDHSCLPVAALAGVLPDGFVIEVCLAAARWWREAATIVRRGKLITIDYGAAAEALLNPERPGGTLRAYRNHQISPDPLASPGDQDLTAHVNFTAIEVAGADAGLSTETFVTQSQFLTPIAARAWNQEVPFGEWNSGRTRQFQTLTHPEHLGRAFRVLVQAPDPSQPQPGACSS